MIRLSRSALLPVAPAAARAVVLAVERYPEFVPGCDGVRVLERTAEGLIAEVRVSGKGLTESFVTRNVHAEDRVEMVLVEGPLRTLAGRWTFVPIGDAGCRVQIDIDFEAGGLLGRMLTPVADRVANRLVDAFSERISASGP